MPSYQAQEVHVNGHTVKVATNMEIRPGYSPYIGENGNWYVYDITVKAFVDTGVSATPIDIHVSGTTLVIDTTVPNGNEVSY